MRMTPDIGCNDALDVHRVNAMLMTYVSYVGLEGRTGLTYGLRDGCKRKIARFCGTNVIPQSFHNLSSKRWRKRERERVDNIITNL